MSEPESSNLYARVHSAADTSVRFEGLDASMAVVSVAVTPADGARIEAALAAGGDVPVIELWSTTPPADEGNRISARILSRRGSRGSSGAIDAAAIRWGGIVVNADSHVVAVEGKAVPLTLTEFAILQTLMSAPTRVFPRASLMMIVGIGGMDGDERLLDVHCSRLRKKIQQAGGPRIITAVRGIGYRLADASPEL